MSEHFAFRSVEENDVKGLLEIYRHYVLHTAITFEYEVPTPESYLQRIRTNTEKYPWLVCTFNNKPAGFAYGSTFRTREAYQWSPESTIYLAQEVQGKGIGKLLYQALFDILKLQGYCNVFAGMALPNVKSEALHTTLGFDTIGVYHNIGFKFGQWHSTKWFQLKLSEYNAPSTPLTPAALKTNEAYTLIVNEANSKLQQLTQGTNV
jgi:L-amino acid N-acyltransferase YncA